MDDYKVTIDVKEYIDLINFKREIESNKIEIAVYNKPIVYKGTEEALIELKIELDKYNEYLKNRDDLSVNKNNNLINELNDLRNGSILNFLKWRKK